MSETDTTPAALVAPSFDFDAYMASHAEHQAREASLVDGNKAALFKALAAAGITHVTVVFDGYGDSGQIESIDAYCDDTLVALPDSEVMIASASWGDPGIAAETLKLADAVEQMAYGFLAGTHGGWENNDGAYGEFCFDARAGTIQLDFNERFTSSEHYDHAF
ncbi:hypothetical protein D2T29_22025 [Sinirhodobacter populi]|uniref:DUF6878 domain-containing protein n=1 Tax=Paenirhodobacter populi TaxID=2306993 RepID=A0A443IQM4_9RHOB|nr:DUF6878 family protein [Sinirhodobacter populi]RWR09198.1 hypothetical protein D2T33_14470 [Sinirhodobacter populi]RWR25493.1 hypothetical protein D2T29_22025 [Sinirhodobacter populi]RWR25896.1 hypothetical protein D2T31_21475 [Sinirhodobacter populi]